MLQDTTHPPPMSDDSSQVLFAISDQPVRTLVAVSLLQCHVPYAYALVSSHAEAHHWLRMYRPLCVVMTLDIALGTGPETSLVAGLPALIPTVSLVQRSALYPRFPEYLYAPRALHDWCTMPFTMEELLARIQQGIDRARQRPRSSIGA